MMPTSKIKTANTLAFLSLLIIAMPVYAANPLLSRMKVTATEVAKDATEKEKEVKDKLKEDEKKAKEIIAKKLQELSKKIKDLEQDINQDLIDGTAAIQTTIVCKITNSANNTHTSGVIILDNGTVLEKGLIHLKNLFPNDPNREHMAIAFSGAVENLTKLQFQLIDLRTGERVIKSGSFADLGLGDLKEKCGPSHRIVFLNNGKVEVNTKDRLPKVLKDVLHALENNIKDVIKEVADAR